MNGPDENTCIIPARCEVVRKFRINGEKECVIDQIILAPGVYTARTIIDPKNAYIRVINTTEKSQIIATKIQNAETLDSFEVYQADKVEKDEKRTEKLKKVIHKNVPQQYRKKMDKLIKEFADVFALPEDKMSVNNFYTQRLRTADSSPTYIKNYRTPHT